MNLNITTEVFVYFISIFFVGYSAYQFYLLYLKNDSNLLRSLLLMSISLTFFSLMGFLQNLLLSEFFYQIQSIFIILIGLFSIMSFDYFHRYSVDAIKMYIFGIISTGFFYANFSTDNIVVTTLSTGESTIKSIGTLYIWSSLIAVFVTMPFFLVTARIYRISPKNNHTSDFMLLAGGISYGLLLSISYVTHSIFIIPGIFPFFSALGIFLVMLSIKLNPTIIEVLINNSRKARFKEMDKILKLCAYCKNTKNLQGFWVSIEKFFFDNSNLKFTHGICEDCMQKNFPELNK